MDPRIQEAAAIIQKLMEVISMMAEELQNAKGGDDGKKKEENQQGDIQKQASYSDSHAIASELGLSVVELPEFLKYASAEQFNAIRERIVFAANGDDLTKVAFIGGMSDEDFDLNARLSDIAYS